MVIVLVGIVFAIGGILLSQFFDSYFAATNISEADWQGKVAFERMAREIRLVRSNTSTDLDFTSGTQVRFTDMYGNNVCFYQDAVNSRLMRSADGPTTACGTTNPQVLADNVSSLGFTYWDKNAVTAVSVTGVYYITVAVTVSHDVYSGSFRTNVRPRNFF